MSMAFIYEKIEYILTEIERTMRIISENNRIRLSLSLLLSSSVSISIDCNTKQLFLLKYSHSFLFLWFQWIVRCAVLRHVFVLHIHIWFRSIPIDILTFRHFQFEQTNLIVMPFFMVFLWSIYFDRQSDFSAVYSYYWNG